MRKSFRLVFVFLWVVVVAGLIHAQTNVIAIRGARVIDGTGAPARAATVIVEGDRIKSVGADVTVPTGARVIDATGLTLLPGFFDLHTHAHAPTLRNVQLPDWGKVLKSYLASGVTTINDFSAYGEMFAPERKLQSTGALLGPHVNLAVRLSTPGGHGTEGGWGDFFTLPVNTPVSAHAAMQQALAYKPDVIKVFTDGWRYGTDADLSSINVETLAAIVEDAHAAGLKVFTHTVTLGGAKLAVRGGVDVLAHGVGDAMVDDELIQLMKEKGTVYVPTMAVYEPKGQRVQAPPDSPGMRRWRTLQENLRRLHAAGITASIGTDAGITGTFHGPATLREMELFVDSGYSPLEALTAGTGVAARVLGTKAADRGTIESGKVADLVLVDGKPDEKISDVERTARVILGGTEMDLKALDAAIHSEQLTPLPSHPVAELVDDLDRADGRTNLNTLIVASMDAGVDHSQILFTRVEREDNGHALSLVSHMAPKKSPFTRLQVPLTEGGVELADVSGFQGVTFDVRGGGEFRLLMDNYGPAGAAASPFKAGAKWETVRIPFSQLQPLRNSRNQNGANGAAWDPKKVRTMIFELAGAAGADAWLQIDNIRFYR